MRPAAPGAVRTRETVTATRIGLLLGLCCASAAAAPKPGDQVVVRPGAKVVDGPYGDTERGRVLRARTWKVTDAFDEWLTLERRVDGLIERITVTADSVGGDPDATPTKLVAVTLEDCTVRGRCNFALVARKRLDEYLTERSVVEARTRVAFHHPVEVCKLGPVYRFTIDRKAPDWLAPAASTAVPVFGRTYQHESTVEILAGTTPAVPPTCPAKRGRNINKLVVGGTSNRPQMGLFALTPKDARAVHAKFGKLKEAYDHALVVARKRWARDRTFCEDAVRQSLRFLGGSLDAGEQKRWRSAKLVDVKRKHWNEIVVRYAWMIDEYAPGPCAKDLATYVEALKFAATHELELANFGY